MSDDNYEPNRVLGYPLGTRTREGEEPQRALGMPADWLTEAGSQIKILKHPIRAVRQWNQRRRLGPYAPDDRAQ